MTGAKLHLVQAIGVGASVALCTAAFPPGDQRWLAWVALVPLLLAARLAGARAAFALGLIWGLAAFFVVLDSVPFGVVDYFGQPGWFASPFSAFAFTVNGAL